MNYLKKVKEFHELFDHPVLEKPEIPNRGRCQLRVSLLEEELNEFTEALKNKDIVEAADALCDLQYVLSGAILELGLESSFKKLFKEVQRSNMSKACKTLEEAGRTQAHYLGQGIVSYIKPKGDFYLVFRSSDNKVLKSIDYSPANLKEILKNS